MNVIHNQTDITPEGAENRVQFSFPDQAEEIMKNRFRLLRSTTYSASLIMIELMICSIWHPLFGPILDYPLAVCDSRTVAEEDLVESDYIYPNFEGENFMVKASEAHRWYYMKEQDQDDVLIITNYDSETGKRKSIWPLYFACSLIQVYHTRVSSFPPMKRLRGCGRALK